MPSFTGFKDMIGVKLKNGSRDPEHAHYRSGLSSKPKHLIYSTGLTAIQNLATVASAVLDIWLRAMRLKNESRDTEHAPLGVVCHP